MRKTVVFSFLLIFLSTLFASCRKTHKCTCKFVYPGGDYTSVAAAQSTKRDAESWCVAIEASNAQPGVTTTCKLD